MAEWEEILTAAKRVLVVDWPSRDVPESLARGGLEVVVHGGPRPDAYTSYEMADGEVVQRWVGRPPDSADLVYTHRPLHELPGIVETAQRLGARTVWVQSGVAEDGERDPSGCWLSPEDGAEARSVVEAAGLGCVTEPYIGDAVRQVRRGGAS